MMGFTYDPATDTGKVRMLIPDRNASSLAMQDEEIAAILTLETNVFRAAALALETIASDLAASLRITEVLGLKVDGVAAAKALLQRSGMLRQQADEFDARTGGMFDWAEMVFDEFTIYERIWDDMLRAS